MEPLFYLFALVVVAYVWYDSMRAREYVISHCRKLCQGAEVQFLDQTTALVSLSIKRNSRLLFVLRRIYQFEVSENGANRLSGYVVMDAGRITDSHLETSDGHNVFHPPGSGH